MSMIRDKYIVTSKKDNKCSYCNKLIRAGEQYELSVHVDGVIFNWKECSRCKQFVEEAILNKEYDWTDGMNNADFENYMLEEHRETLKKWKAEDREAKAIRKEDNNGEQ